MGHKGEESSPRKKAKAGLAHAWAGERHCGCHPPPFAAQCLFGGSANTAGDRPPPRNPLVEASGFIAPGCRCSSNLSPKAPPLPPWVTRALGHAGKSLWASGTTVAGPQACLLHWHHHSQPAHNPLRGPPQALSHSGPRQQPQACPTARQTLLDMLSFRGRGFPRQGDPQAPPQVLSLQVWPLFCEPSSPPPRQQPTYESRLHRISPSP